MKSANVMTTLRDWAALACAMGMVAFLTFVPQHGQASASAGPSVSARPVATDWPSRTASLAEDTAARR